MKSPLLSIAMLAILVSGIVSIGNISLSDASTGVTGRIDSDTTWTKAASPYTFTGNVLVSTGVTLTIEAGVTVNLNDYLMMVNGTLRARGTSSDKIQFKGGSITITESSSSWNEAAGTGCIIEYANIDSQLSVKGSPKITSCTMQSIGISHNTIFTNNFVNKDASVGGSALVSENTFNGALRLNSDAGTPLISSNTVLGGLSIGYLAGSPTISHNTITGGVTADGTNSVIIDSNTITGAISFSAENGTISNNNIKGTISTSSDALTISSNVISETDVAIALTPESPAGYVNVTITDNRINARQTGIMVPPTFSASSYGWYCKALVSGNTIIGCANSGINVGGGEAQAGHSTSYNNVTILNNRFFSNNYAISTEGIGRIEGNVIVNNYWGISGGGPIINNIVAGNTYGIASGTLEGNFVTNNKYGVVNQYGASGFTLNRNTITNNEVGIAGGFADLHYNNIYGNKLNVNFTIATDGNATYNWGGTTDTAAISQSIHDYEEDFLLGRVNFNPTLTSLNPSAPSPDTEIPTVDSPTPTTTAEPSATPQPSVPELPVQTMPLLIVILSAVVLGTAVIIKKQKAT